MTSDPTTGLAQAPTPDPLTGLARQFSLASLLVSYPDEEAGLTLVSLADDLPAMPPLSALLRSPGGVDELRSAYIDLFDRGQGRASLYETEYGRMRGMAKGNDLADISGFYAAFGLTLDDDARELLDHLGIELEFYTLLLLKQAALARLDDAEGGAIVRDARQKFIVDHLGRLASAVAALDAVREHPLYGPVFTWCWGLVRAECAALDVTPAPLDFFTDEEAKEEVKCGGFRLPMLPT